MSDDKIPDPEKIFERIIDGGPVVSVAQKAAGKFFESAIERLDKQIDTVFNENKIDAELAAILQQMTKELIRQLEARLRPVLEAGDDRGKERDSGSKEGSKEP